jgi:hypothetical protein
MRLPCLEKSHSRDAVEGTEAGQQTHVDNRSTRGGDLILDAATQITNPNRD